MNSPKDNIKESSSIAVRVFPSDSLCKGSEEENILIEIAKDSFKRDSISKGVSKNDR